MLYEHNLKELYQKLAKTSGFDVFTEHGIHALKSPTVHPALNNAFGHVTHQSLDTLATIFKNIPFCFLLDTENQTDHQKLVSHNFIPQGALPEMVLTLSKTPDVPNEQISKKITIVPIYTNKLFQTWCSIASEVLQVPLTITQQYNQPIFDLGTQDALLYLGYYNNTPAATGMAHIGSNTLCISSVAVLPQFRRQGLAKAITQACLQAPKPPSVDQATLIAFAMARTLYENMGFKTTRYIRAFSCGV